MEPLRLQVMYTGWNQTLQHCERCQSNDGRFLTGSMYIMHRVLQRAGLFIVGQVYFQRMLRICLMLSIPLCEHHLEEVCVEGREGGEYYQQMCL